jgi:hypothetical protein
LRKFHLDEHQPNIAVMPGPVPGIHVFAALEPKQDVDGRDDARP